MVLRKVKAAYFAIASPFMWLNGIIYRHFRAPTQEKVVKVHLGPGQRTYLDEWLNLDANIVTGTCDVWVDFRNPLPFRENTVNVFYSHHMIEHLPDLQFHFNDMYRCLKPGGFIRVGGPHGDNAAKKFLENDSDWFVDFPDSRKSIGGRFENFIFCRQEHLTILTLSYLEEICENAGFKKIEACSPGTETHEPEFIDDQVLSKERESHPECPHTLLIEAWK